MKKLIFGIIFLFCVNSYAINGFSIYKMYTQYDTVTHTNLDSNLNRPASWSSLLVDTLDRKFIRFSDLTNGDTTLSSIKVDTIRSNPYIDSTKGNTIHTGDYTITGAATSATLNTGLGNNELHPMDQSVLTTSPVVFSTVNTGNGDNELYAMDQNIRTTDAPTFATVNTGNGANELYPMDQAVTTTSDVAFDSTRTRINVADSIKLGTGSYLKTYDTGSFACTLKVADVLVQQVGVIRYTIIGNVVTLLFPTIYGISNSVNHFVYFGAIPQSLRPGVYTAGSIGSIIEGTSISTGTFAYNPSLGNFLKIYKYDGSNYANGSPKGFEGSTITYIK